jgi:hypothetical protein
MVKFWENNDQIQNAIFKTLSDFSDRKELIGWVRGNKAIDNGVIAEEIARLAKENAELREKLGNSSEVRYAGFTFNDMRAILEGQLVTEDGIIKNLFDCLVENGPRLAAGTGRNNRNAELLDGLILVKMVAHKIGTMVFQFTDDGHKFYLKALYHNPPAEPSK